MGPSLRKFWTVGFVAASVLALATGGCGDDDDDTTSQGGAGSGTGGSKAGAGGSKAGTGGSTAGKGGSTAGTGVGGEPVSVGGDTGVGGDSGVGGAVDSGGAGGDTSVGGASGGEGGGSAALTCADYCGLVQADCSAADGQYPTVAQCLASCAAFPTDVGNNSFACRLGEAEQVAGDASHCDAAGPAGVGVCGTPCDAYCNLMTTYCANEPEGASLNDCMTACAQVPGNDITAFTYPAPAGNTLACRIAHATNAAANTGPARLNHCTHAAGDAICL